MSKQEANGGMAPSKKRKTDRRWPIVAAVVAVVVAVASGGFWVWHEQPSFCNAICHTPMDRLRCGTYDQQPGPARPRPTSGATRLPTRRRYAGRAVHAAPKDEGGADAHVPKLPPARHQPSSSTEASASGLPATCRLCATDGVPRRRAWPSAAPSQLGRVRAAVAGDAFCLNEDVPQHNPPRPHGAHRRRKRQLCRRQPQSAHGHARPAARLWRLPQGAPRFGERVQPVPRGCSHPRWLADIRPSAGNSAARIRRV